MVVFPCWGLFSAAAVFCTSRSSRTRAEQVGKFSLVGSKVCQQIRSKSGGDVGPKRPFKMYLQDSQVQRLFTTAGCCWTSIIGRVWLYIRMIIRANTYAALRRAEEFHVEIKILSPQWAAMLHVYIKPHPFQMEFGGCTTITRKGIPSVCLWKEYLTYKVPWD